jgi:hypothetical protein
VALAVVVTRSTKSITTYTGGWRGGLCSAEIDGLVTH